MKEIINCIENTLEGVEKAIALEAINSPDGESKFKISVLKDRYDSLSKEFYCFTAIELYKKLDDCISHTMHSITSDILNKYITLTGFSREERKRYEINVLTEFSGWN